MRRLFLLMPIRGRGRAEREVIAIAPVLSL
jgi:hypothetical protein